MLMADHSIYLPSEEILKLPKLYECDGWIYYKYKPHAYGFYDVEVVRMKIDKYNQTWIDLGYFNNKHEFVIAEYK
jgi:hypothetical protein